MRDAAATATRSKGPLEPHMHYTFGKPLLQRAARWRLIDE